MQAFLLFWVVLPFLKVPFKGTDPKQQVCHSETFYV